jgi:cytochrome c-type biogenesis protein CcmH/NrfF
VRRALVALAATLALLGAAPVAGACPKTTLGDVEDEVMCPVCGTPLGLATESPQAIRERELIRRLVNRCQSKEQVKKVLVAEYGEAVLSVPDDEGFELAAYVVPALALLAAAGGLGMVALRWRGRRGGPGPSPDAGPAGETRKRLDSDIERYEL